MRVVYWANSPQFGVKSLACNGSGLAMTSEMRENPGTYARARVGSRPGAKAKAGVGWVRAFIIYIPHATGAVFFGP